MHTRSKFTTILILGLLSAIGPFSIDMYLPAFQTIAKDLQTEVSQVQLSLTSFFFGIGVGQLFYGPLLDRFGRKVPLIVGLVLYVGASLACAVTNSIELFILYRFIQALGGCSGMVASRAMVRDLFPPSESAKIFSLLMLVIGLSPIIAPTLGGYIATHAEWHNIFFLLAIFGVLILSAVLFLLPESKGPDPSISLKPIPTMTNFWKVLSKRQFITYALCGALVASGMYVYLSGSPFVLMDLYGVNEKQYGWIFGLLASALIIANQVNVIALRRISSQRAATIALTCQLIACCLYTFVTLLGKNELYGTLLFIFIFMGSQGFIFPNASAMAISPFSRLAGSASALLGCLQMGLGSIFSGLVSVFHNGTVSPMVVLMMICSAGSFAALLFAPKRTTPAHHIHTDSAE